MTHRQICRCKLALYRVHTLKVLCVFAVDINELVLMFLSKKRKNSHESADFHTQESELLSYIFQDVSGAHGALVAD